MARAQNSRIIKYEIEQLGRLPGEEIFCQKCEVLLVWQCGRRLVRHRARLLAHRRVQYQLFLWLSFYQTYLTCFLYCRHRYVHSDDMPLRASHCNHVVALPRADLVNFNGAGVEQFQGEPAINGRDSVGTEGFLDHRAHATVCR